MLRFKSAGHAQRLVEVYGIDASHFNHDVTCSPLLITAEQHSQASFTRQRGNAGVRTRKEGAAPIPSNPAHIHPQPIAITPVRGRPSGART